MKTSIKDTMYKNKYSDLLSSVPSPFRSGLNSEAINSFNFFMGVNIPRGNVLDIGCHDGYFLHLLKKEGYKVQGVEPSPAGNIAKKHGIPVIRKYFSNKLFKPSSFDIVILRNILEHIWTLSEFMENVYEVLKPKGYVFIEVPNTPWLMKHGVGMIFFHQHISYFSINTLKYLLSIHSIKIVKSKKGYFLYIVGRKK